MNMRMLTTIAITTITVGAAAVAVANGSILPDGMNDASPRTELPDNGRAIDPRDYSLARHGFKRGAGREITAPASGKKQYVYDSPDWRCVADTDGSSVCADSKMIANGRSFGIELCIPDLPSDQIRVRGVVPSGVKEVTVKTASSTRVFPAALGATAFEIPRSEARGEISVTWSTGGATVIVPPQFADSTCGP